MNVYDALDPVFSGRLCLTLFHSAWQIALLGFAASVVDRLFRKKSAQRSYSLHVSALCIGLAALPMTYALLEIRESKGASSSRATDARQLAVRDSTAEASATLVATDPINAAARATSSPAASVNQTAVAWQSLAPWAVAAYLTGVTLMLARMIGGVVSANRLGARARPLVDGPLVATLHSLARAWSMRMAPTLAVADRIIAPKVVGLLRPTILLPASAATGLSVDEVQMILAHELAHVRRHDMWIVLVQRLGETALFYNPALWLLSRRISTLREYCCDDVACQSQGNSASQLRYAAALLRLVELGAPGAVASGNLAALAASGRSPSELRRRVARLLGEPIREPLRLTRGMAMGIAAFASLVVLTPALAPSRAQPTVDAAAATPEGEQTGNRATKRFSFGAVVEFLGMGTHDETPARWWNEQGKPLESVPFTWKKKANDSVSSPDPVWRRIVFRIRELPDDAEVNWRIVGAHATADGEATVDGQQQPKGYFTRYFGVGADQKTVTLNIRIAKGPWITAAETSGGGMSAVAVLDRCIVFSGAMKSKDGTMIVVSHNDFEHNVRIVAIDKQGVTHASPSSGYASAGQILQTPKFFPGLKQDDIDRFEFQTRDYERVEFKNLPIEPRGK